MLSTDRKNNLIDPQQFQYAYANRYYSTFWAALSEDTRITLEQAPGNVVIIRGSSEHVRAATESAHLAAIQAARSEQSISEDIASSEQKRSPRAFSGFLPRKS